MTPNPTKKTTPTANCVRGMRLLAHVSCIITYHNGSQTITRAIDSVLDNPHCLEIIIVSDGATIPIHGALHDKHHVAIKNGRIKLIELATNVGVGIARNIGVSVARGRYVSFLDQDDEYLPEIYDQTVAFLDKNSHVGCLVLPIEIYENGQPCLTPDDPRLDAITKTVVWNLIIRHNVFWQSGGFPTHDVFRGPLGSEDMAFRWGLHRLFNSKIVTGSKPLVRHHIHRDNTTGRFLQRTEVRNGKVVFVKPNDTTAHALKTAMHSHLHWATVMFKESERCKKPQAL